MNALDFRICFFFSVYVYMWHEYDVVVSCSNVICGIVRITRSHTSKHTHTIP